MEINHIHLDRVDSTQQYLKSYLEQHGGDTPTLVSTSQQTKGVGRRGTQWDHFEHALAFSFALKPTATITLTPLEMGIHLAKYFTPHLRLKWPNDLINNHGGKVGGIICQLWGDIVLVGIGINLVLPEQMDQNYPYPVGQLFQKANTETLGSDYKRNIPLEIYKSLIETRLSDTHIIKQWNEHCFHLNKNVKITDGKTTHQGLFINIGKNGEAILKNNKTNQENKVLTGSLRIITDA